MGVISMASIEELAVQMQSALQNSPQFQEVNAAFQAVKQDPNSYSVFKQFQGFQAQMQQKLATGQELTQQDQQQGQQLAFTAQNDPKIVALMNAEQKLNEFIGSINGIIMQPIQKLYMS